MTDATAPVTAAIARAEEELQTALAALAALTVVEADALAVTQHTLHNYLALTSMTLEVVLRDLFRPDREKFRHWCRHSFQTPRTWRKPAK